MIGYIIKLRSPNPLVPIYLAKQAVTQTGDGGYSTPRLNEARVYKTEAGANRWLDDRRCGAGFRPRGQVVPVGASAKHILEETNFFHD